MTKQYNQIKKTYISKAINRIKEMTTNITYLFGIFDKYSKNTDMFGIFKKYSKNNRSVWNIQ